MSNMEEIDNEILNEIQWTFPLVSRPFDEIAKKAPGIIDAPAKLLKEQEEYKKEISDYTTLKETLEVVKKLNVDLTGFGLMKKFYTNLFIVQTKDIDEIKRTLYNVTINQYPLNTKEED